MGSTEPQHTPNWSLKPLNLFGRPCKIFVTQLGTITRCYHPWRLRFASLEGTTSVLALWISHFPGSVPGLAPAELPNHRSEESASPYSH